MVQRMLNRLPPHTPLHSDLQDLKDTLSSAERQDAERLVKKEMTISELQNSVLTLHGENDMLAEKENTILGLQHAVIKLEVEGEAPID